MPNLYYTKIRDEDGEQITVNLAGDFGRPYVAHDSHPAWDRILAMVDEDDPNVVKLFDLAYAVTERISLGERVSYGNGMVFLDSDPIGDSLATHIVRLIEGDEDFAPLVALLENIAQNPSESSRTQMYDFLRANDFTTTYDGLIVGYKGVSMINPAEAGVRLDDTYTYESINAGRAFVNGKLQEGRIQQNLGDVVEMPRDEVVEDPSRACSTGLHVAAHSYASHWSYEVDAVLEVHVHPRDVVSVPSGYGDDAQKVRVCRYHVVGERDEPYDIPVLPPPTLVEPISVPVTVPLASDVKHPDQKAFDEMVAAAKRRHRPVRKFIEKRTDWTYIDGGDPKDVHSWTIS